MKTPRALPNRDPQTNFDALWTTFHNRYAFFDLRQVNWEQQYHIHRPRVSPTTSDHELFDILCDMLDPLNDGHVELEAKIGHPAVKRRFTAEKPCKFHREFSKRRIKELFQTTRRTLTANGFGRYRNTKAWMIRYCRSQTVGYLRIIELEGISKKKLKSALDKISRSFKDLNGFIIDIRDNPGGEDSTGRSIANRFADQKRIAYHRRTKRGSGQSDFGPLRTWFLKPQGRVQFTRPVILLTCDAVFSGAETFALSLRDLPHVTILGDHTNGIFSYQLEKRLPNRWTYRLSHQEYLSADMVCYEGRGVPADIEHLNVQADLESGFDPLIQHALRLLMPQNDNPTT